MWNSKDKYHSKLNFVQDIYRKELDKIHKTDKVICIQEYSELVFEVGLYKILAKKNSIIEKRVRVAAPDLRKREQLELYTLLLRDFSLLQGFKKQKIHMKCRNYENEEQ